MALNINEETMAQLSAAGKPIVIDFWATWCGPCKRMAPVVEALAEEYEGRVSIGKCDVEESEGLAAKFGVTSIPTLVFLTPDGKEVGRIVGAQSKSRVEEELRKLL